MTALLFITTIPELNNDSLFSMMYEALFLKEPSGSRQPTDSGILLAYSIKENTQKQIQEDQ